MVLITLVWRPANTTAGVVFAAVMGGLALVALVVRLLWRRRTAARANTAGAPARSLPPPADPPPS